MTVSADVSAHERAFIAGVRAGCAESFERMVAHYHPRILAYLTRQTADPELAADIAQHTFLDAFSFIDRVTHSQSIAAWLYSVAHNKLREEWRRRQIRHVVSLEWLYQCGDSRELAHNDDASACQERDLVQQVLNHLTPSLREALVLSSVAGFSSKDVAQIQGISDATARQRISRAKEAFRLRYNILNGDDHDGRMQPTEREVGGVH